MYKKISVILILCITIILSSCTKQMSKSEEAWNRIIKSGENTKVNIVYDINYDIEDWLKKDFEVFVSNAHGIKLDIDNMSIEKLTKDLLSHKEDTEPKGDIDIAIINAEDFEKLKTLKLLYEPFSEKLPNYQKYMSSKDYSNIKIGFVDINDGAVPFTQRQLSYFYNGDLVFDPPEDLDSLQKFVVENPGKFSYPNPKTEEGKAFLQSVILSFVNEREFTDDKLSEKELRALILPAFEYLKELRPYLKGAGSFHPMDMKDYDSLFSKGEIYIIMSLDHLHGDKMIDELAYPDYTRAFEFIKSSVSDRTYAVIPSSSKNKSGAMLVLNSLLSFEMQESMYKNERFSSTPVFSKNNVDNDTKAKLDKKTKKKTVLKPSKMIEMRKNPIPDKYWNYILKEWQKL